MTGYRHGRQLTVRQTNVELALRLSLLANLCLQNKSDSAGACLTTLDLSLALFLLELLDRALRFNLAAVRLECARLVQIEKRRKVVSAAILWAQVLLEAREGVICDTVMQA